MFQDVRCMAIYYATVDVYLTKVNHSLCDLGFSALIKGDPRPIVIQVAFRTSPIIALSSWKTNITLPSLSSTFFSSEMEIIRELGKSGNVIEPSNRRELVKLYEHFMNHAR